VSDIGNGIEKVLKMPQEEYNELVRRGLEQASRFSWEKAARETLKVLEKAI
jgi:glycosyltransferase involved in cell wall biosynthesis